MESEVYLLDASRELTSQESEKYEEKTWKIDKPQRFYVDLLESLPFHLRGCQQLWWLKTDLKERHDFL